ncbi:hypothetical protein GCM10027294_33850 [Marinactinospora endophytica]
MRFVWHFCFCSVMPKVTAVRGNGYPLPRHATADDIDELVRLRAYLLSTGEGPYTARTPEDEEVWRQAYRKWLEPVTAGSVPTVRVSVIGSPGSLLACAIAVVDHRAPTARCPSGRVGWVQTVVVDPSARRQGLGRRVMDDALCWLREAGAESVVLQTTRDGAPLYRSLGFAPTGEDLLYLDVRGC